MRWRGARHGGPSTTCSSASDDRGGAWGRGRRSAADPGLRPARASPTSPTSPPSVSRSSTLPLYVTGPVGSDEAGAGLAFGAFGVTALVCRPFAGRLSDRLGRRPLMLGGRAAGAVGMVLMPVVEALPWVIALRLLQGVAEAAFFVAGFAMLADLAPPAPDGGGAELQLARPLPRPRVRSAAGRAAAGDVGLSKRRGTAPPGWPCWPPLVVAGIGETRSASSIRRRAREADLRPRCRSRSVSSPRSPRSAGSSPSRRCTRWRRHGPTPAWRCSCTGVVVVAAGCCSRRCPTACPRFRSARGLVGRDGGRPDVMAIWRTADRACWLARAVWRSGSRSAPPRSSPRSSQAPDLASAVPRPARPARSSTSVSAFGPIALGLVADSYGIPGRSAREPALRSPVRSGPCTSRGKSGRTSYET